MGELITRQMACKRLLRSAIKSYVRQDEPLATHLSVHAAFRVCRDLVKKSQPQKDWFRNVVDPDRFKEIEGEISRVSSFLKHADKNPINEIDLGDINERNMHDIILVCAYYETAFATKTDIIINAYKIWYLLKFNGAIEEEEKENFEKIKSIINLDSAWDSLRFVAQADAELLNEFSRRNPQFDW